MARACSQSRPPGRDRSSPSPRISSQARRSGSHSSTIRIKATGRTGRAKDVRCRSGSSCAPSRAFIPRLCGRSCERVQHRWAQSPVPSRCSRRDQLSRQHNQLRLGPDLNLAGLKARGELRRRNTSCPEWSAGATRCYCKPCETEAGDNRAIACISGRAAHGIAPQAIDEAVAIRREANPDRLQDRQLYLPRRRQPYSADRTGCRVHSADLPERSTTWARRRVGPS
jgi:hypothetical protein